MDYDIRESLQELSRHVQTIGRDIGSTNINDIDRLMILREALRGDALALNVYIRILKLQIKE